MSAPDINREALAIAYLTGQASETEISEYQTLFKRDESFRALVREVELWLAPLNADMTEVDAPDGLLESILAEMTPVTPISPPQHSSQRPGGREAAVNDNSAGRWKALTAAACLVAAFSVGSHFVELGGKKPQEIVDASDVIIAEQSAQANQLLAVLSDDSQPQLVAIVYDPKTGKIVAHLSNVVIPDDSDLELWLIRDGEAAPQSLGVMERASENKQMEFDIPTALSDGTDTLAISLERKGGSSTGAPEGPVLLTGGVSNLRRDI